MRSSEFRYSHGVGLVSYYHENIKIEMITIISPSNQHLSDHSTWRYLNNIFCIVRNLCRRAQPGTDRHRHTDL